MFYAFSIVITLMVEPSQSNMSASIKFYFVLQAAAIRLEIRGGDWKDAYMQMDGEPWKQPLNKDYSTFVEIKRVPFHSLMISGEWYQWVVFHLGIAGIHVKHAACKLYLYASLQCICCCIKSIVSQNLIIFLLIAKISLRTI